MTQEYSTYRNRIINFAEKSPDLSTHEHQQEAIMKNFWRQNHRSFPEIAQLVARYYCMTLTPSSAAAERIFSILKQMFSLNQMHSTLEDVVEASVMLRANDA